MQYLGENGFYGRQYDFGRVNGYVKTIQQDYDDKLKQSQSDYQHYLEQYRQQTQ